MPGVLKIGNFIDFDVLFVNYNKYTLGQWHAETINFTKKDVET